MRKNFIEKGIVIVLIIVFVIVGYFQTSQIEDDMNPLEELNEIEDSATNNSNLSDEQQSINSLQNQNSEENINQNKTNTQSDNDESVASNESNSQSQTEDEPIFIDIGGAVNNPGLYELPKSARVADAIEKAGGVLEEADLTFINLSSKLEDEMKIIIPTKSLVEEYLENQNKENLTDKYFQIESSIEQMEGGGNGEKNKEEPNQTSSSLININTASVEELMSLPSIGEKKAHSIVEYRSLTPFQTIEDLMNVSGIGPKIFEELRNKITI